MGKIATLSEIRVLSKKYRDAKKTIVFTNGCFDILHAGHVKYLNHAANLGDILVLGLNSDISVKLIKGENRPVIGQEHRSEVVAALSSVDYVVLFDDPDPEALIKVIMPDILVKGADWPEDQIIGGEFVKKNKGRIERVDLEPGISTTTIIKRIGELYYGKQ
ncbi:MAG: D-glycero-beta-D-manno-heptose 1-phosphate adenylyltransferase [Thermodesulfobacteriota bacterium]